MGITTLRPATKSISTLPLRLSTSLAKRAGAIITASASIRLSITAKTPTSSMTNASVRAGRYTLLAPSSTMPMWQE